MDRRSLIKQAGIAGILAGWCGPRSASANCGALAFGRQLS